MTANKTRILLADDHPIVRQGVRALLEAEIPEIEIVYEASDGQMALEKARELRPEVLILDISMPLMSGLEVAAVVRREMPESSVILLTMHEGDEYFFQGLSVGASGYVVKGADGTEIAAAVQAVVEGGLYIHPSLAKKLVGDYLTTKETAAFDGLTQRESEVLRHVADGLTNKQIAEKLFISVTTVQTHRAHVLRKLDLHNQTELVKYAIRRGILAPDAR